MCKFTIQKNLYPVSKVRVGSSSFRNPLNYDMDYRICNVRTWPFLCVRIHTGVGDDMDGDVDGVESIVQVDR